MAWKNRPLYSKVIAIVTICLIVINIFLAIILPIILNPATESFVINTLIIQWNVLLPITSVFLIITLIDIIIRFFKKAFKLKSCTP